MELQSMTIFGIMYTLACVLVLLGGGILAGYLHGRHMDRVIERELKSVTDPNRY